MATFFEEVVGVKTVKLRSLASREGTKDGIEDNLFYKTPSGKYAIVRVLALSRTLGDFDSLRFGPGEEGPDNGTGDYHTQISDSVTDNSDTERGQAEIYLDEGEEIWRSSSTSVSRTWPVIWFMVFEFNKP